MKLYDYGKQPAFGAHIRLGKDLKKASASELNELKKVIPELKKLSDSYTLTIHRLVNNGKPECVVRARQSGLFGYLKTKLVVNKSARSTTKPWSQEGIFGAANKAIHQLFVIILKFQKHEDWRKTLQPNVYRPRHKLDW